jgi:hypothetical protein
LTHAPAGWSRDGGFWCVFVVTLAGGWRWRLAPESARLLPTATDGTVSGTLLIRSRIRHTIHIELEAAALAAGLNTPDGWTTGRIKLCETKPSAGRGGHISRMNTARHMSIVAAAADQHLT